VLVCVGKVDGATHQIEANFSLLLTKKEKVDNGC
jgi:hypothetical protein